MMNITKRVYIHVMCASIVMVALGLTAGPAVSGAFDFTRGTLAAPGTELHEMGRQALDEGLGGISYFTNGEGQVVKVQAKEMANGDLRVSTKQVDIRHDNGALSQTQALDADRALKNLETLAGQQPWVGGYAVLPHDEGTKAYELGVMVEAERRRHETGAYHDNRNDCCRGL